jgi:hypothetical protein
LRERPLQSTRSKSRASARPSGIAPLQFPKRRKLLSMKANCACSRRPRVPLCAASQRARNPLTSGWGNRPRSSTWTRDRLTETRPWEREAWTRRSAALEREGRRLPDVGCGAGPKPSATIRGSRTRPERILPRALQKDGRTGRPHSGSSQEATRRRALSVGFQGLDRSVAVNSKSQA